MINNKQDRQGVRTPADLEQKYSWKKNFSELHEIAEGAQKTAEGAKKDVVNLDNKLNQEEIFNRLTNNGELQGLYRDEDGNIYINADYIQSGKFTSTAEVFFEPSTEEVSLIMKYCVGEATIPADQIPLYDFNNDGAITVYDAMLAMWAAHGIQSLADWSGAQKTEVTLTIDPENTSKPIMFTGTNMWGRTFERSFGWDDAFIKSTEGGIMYRLNRGEKEWLNPPFQADTEYRTTERYNSKVVYKKLDSETGHIMWRTEDETEWHDDTATEIEDTNTTYTLSKDGLRIVLTGSDGTTSSVLDAQRDSGMLESIDELTLRVDGIEQNAGKDGAGNDIVETYATKDELDGKADDSHTHSIADISNLQSTLDGKAAKSHTHDDLQLQIDDLQQKAGNYATKEDLEGKADSSHTHSVGDVTGLQNTLDGVGTSIRNLTTATDNLQTQVDDIDQSRGKDSNGNDIVETYATKDELSGKADSGHTHAALSLLDGATGNVQTQINNVRNLADDTSSRVDTIEQNAGKDGSGNDIVETYATKGELSGKANSSHTHSISDVSNLQSTINGINNSINTLQTTVDDIDQERGNYATKDELDGKSDTGHTHSYNELTSKPTIPTSLSSFGVTATAAELNFIDGVTSNVQTQLNGKATRISLGGQCQKTDYSLSVIALCYAPTTASTNNGSYTVGRISVVRSNNLDTPKFVDIEMGAAHGAIGRIRTRYTRTDFAIFEPCTFTYNGVLYGGVKFNPGASCFTYVEFTGTTTFPIFALDIYNTSSKAILNEEVYNSLSSSTVIVSHDLYLGDNAFITSANIGSQSVASATKASQDENGNNIVNTYATKSALNSAVNDLSNAIDNIDQSHGKDGNGNDIVETYATKGELTSHTGNKSNPHGVTKAQVGLGNVDNTADKDKSVNHATSADTATSANQVFVNRSNANNYFPVMLTNIGDRVTSRVDSVYAPYNNTVTMNPSTGALKANSFVGNAISATKATQDGNGNTISTYYMKRGTYERIEGTPSARKNLDNYTTLGFYNVKTAYVDNCPSGIGIDAALLVYPWDSSGYECQEITETAACTTSRRWIRHKNGSTWTAWVEMVTSQNIGSFVSSGGGVVDITSSVSVSSSYGDHPIKKAVDTGSSILILFNGEQEFADINITFPFYLQSKLCVSAFLYGENGTVDLAATEGLFDVQLDAFWSSYCGYGSSLKIEYV